MRKWLLLFLLFAVLLIGSVYALIPSKMTLKQDVQLKVANKAFHRTILDENLWKQWWPGEVVASEAGRNAYQFVFHGNRYNIVGKHLTSQAIKIDIDEGTLHSQLLFIPADDGSLTVTWQAAPVTSSNPLQRFRRYRSLQLLQQDWQLILDRLKKFYSAETNLYGLAVRAELVKDSNLISTSIRTQEPPSTDTVYHLVDKLKAYAHKQGAILIDYPMLNVTRMIDRNEPAYYRVQVAIPVDRKISGEGTISYRWMLAGGDILVTEVKGGPQTINNAFRQMDVYVEEHNRVAPAIPFQSLITDRRAEPDTAKWITKIYWPVM